MSGSEGGRTQQCARPTRPTRNWIDSGYLPAIRIGRPVPVKRADFDALLEANYTGSKQPPGGVWGGDVPAPVSPGENVEHDATPPDVPGDAGEA